MSWMTEKRLDLEAYERRSPGGGRTTTFRPALECPGLVEAWISEDLGRTWRLRRVFDAEKATREARARIAQQPITDADMRRAEELADEMGWE